METFENQYMNQFWSEEPFDRRLRELAWEYLTLTEDYDWTICAGRHGKFAFSRNADERRLSTRYASDCFSRIINTLRSEGYADAGIRAELLAKIRDIRPAFEVQYKPLRPDWGTLPDYAD